MSIHQIHEAKPNQMSKCELFHDQFIYISSKELLLHYLVKVSIVVYGFIDSKVEAKILV